MSQSSRIRGGRCRPMVEPLEPRALLATIVVTTTADSGPGSLRRAILTANRNPGHDTIDFDLPGGEPFVIAPSSPLAAVRGATTIDGTSQPGFSATPVVRLDGRSAGTRTDGLRLFGARILVRGLIIGGFGGDEIKVAGRGRDRLVDNQIGGLPDGSPAPNAGAGIRIINSKFNTVGGGNRIASNGGAGVD